MQLSTVAVKTEHSRVVKSIIPFLCLSFLLHFVFLAVKYQKMLWNPTISQDETIIKVNLQTLNTPKRQIVQTANSQDREVKERAFLSEKNNSFDRETVAQKIASFKEAGLGQEQGQEFIKKKSNKNFSLEKVELGKTKDRAMQQLIRDAALPLLGSRSGKSDLTGLAQSNDFIEEIPLGDLTKLNTVEYKFYGFYFRIKQKLEQYWGLSIKEKAEKIYRQGRRIASDVNHVTSLMIFMDAKGKIIDVKVKSPSGINELDDAAVESFNRAGPFPNPPREMIKNGKVIIEWGFVVKS